MNDVISDTHSTFMKDKVKLEEETQGEMQIAMSNKAFNWSDEEM